MPNVRVVSGLLTLACLAHAGSRQSSDPQDTSAAPVSVAELFALYGSGDFERVDELLKHDRVREELSSTEARFNSKYPPQTRAALYLEATAVACELELHTTIAFGGYSGGDSAAPSVRTKFHGGALFERAVGAVNRVERGEFKVAWQKAAIALAGGANEAGARAVGTGFGPEMLRRILDDKSIDRETRLIAEAFIEETSVWDLIGYGVPAANAPLPATPIVQRYRVLVLSQLDNSLRAAIDKLGIVRNYPEVAEEASLRLGFLLRVRGRPDDLTRARDLLQPLAQRSNDPRIRYLAALFLGRLMEDSGLLDDAEKLYRQAAETKPGAQTARLALAALLYVRGRGESMDEIINSVLNVAANADDPWSLYKYGQYHKWPLHLNAMRAGLR